MPSADAVGDMMMPFLLYPRLCSRPTSTNTAVDAPKLALAFRDMTQMTSRVASKVDELLAVAAFACAAQPLLLGILSSTLSLCWHDAPAVVALQQPPCALN